jgi:copper homeostasis protein (lipoprotein)
MAEIDGQLALRPKPDGKEKTPTVIVKRFCGLWPGETCGALFATSPLQETYWKLTRLGDQPVILEEKQREPHLIFRKEGNRVSGFTGCNMMSGSYELNGTSLRFGQAIGTLMACVKGTEVESAMRKALSSVRQFRIVGEHLELQDGAGKTVARLEARALR